MDNAGKVAKKEPRKRVLYLITKSNWGGAQRYVHDLAQEAQKNGYDVLVAAGGSGELFTKLASSGVATVSIDSLGRDIQLLSEWKAFREIYQLLRQYKPDVLHVNSSKSGIAALAGRLTGVKRIVFTVHGWAFNEDRSLIEKMLLWCLYVGTVLLCHRMIIVSHAAAKQARGMPMLKKNLTVIHNGVFSASLLSKEEARAWLLPDSKRSLWIGSIAELHPIKGLPILIEAYEHFAPDFPSSELLLLGEGGQRSQLERQIRLEGVSGTTHLLGHVPEASRYLQAFDIIVLPSRSENLPYAVLEAGSAECAVVATAVGGIPEIIKDGVTGVLVPYGDRSALTEALERLARNSALREEMARLLKQNIEEHFSLERMCAETFAQYE